MSNLFIVFVFWGYWKWFIVLKICLLVCCMCVEMQWFLYIDLAFWQNLLVSSNGLLGRVCFSISYVCNHVFLFLYGLTIIFSSSFLSCYTGGGVQCNVHSHGESRRLCLWEKAFTLPPLNIALAVRFPVKCFPQSPSQPPTGWESILL